MAMAVRAQHARLMGLAQPVRTSRQGLRAAQRAALKGDYIPPVDQELAAAVAQLAATGSIQFVTKDQLATVRVTKKEEATKPKEEAKSEQKQPKQAKTKAKVEPAQVAEQKTEPKPKATKGLSKAERKAQRKKEQAEKRALAQAKKQPKVKEVQHKTPAKPQAKAQPRQETKAKVQVVAQPKADKPGLVENKARIVRLRELRAKYDKYPVAALDASSLATVAANCEFDFATYLTHLLAGETKEARDFLLGSAQESQVLASLIISPYVDEISNALQAGSLLAETWHSHEEFVPHVKQKLDDPTSRRSTLWIEHGEGGMHDFQFSEKVYVIVRDDEGNVIEEGKCTQIVTQRRTAAYVRWLEMNSPIRKGATALILRDRKGEILNDYSLQWVEDVEPVMVGNLQVGHHVVRSEQFVPLSWDLTKLRHVARARGSQSSRMYRGKEPVLGLVGLQSLEGIRSDKPMPTPANDDEASPWASAMPNPKLEDVPIVAKRNPKILTKSTLARTVRPNPEFKFHTHLGMQPKARAPRFVAPCSETFQYLWLKSMTEPDREVGLRSNPDYRWDPGPPEASTVVKGPDHWFSGEHAVIGKPFVGPPKPALVSPVTHDPSKHPVVGDANRKQDALRMRARRYLQYFVPAMPEGHRSLRTVSVPELSHFPPVTVNIWGRIFAEERKEMESYRKYQAWLRDRHVVNFAHDNDRYSEWLYYNTPQGLQAHLEDMEFNAQSFVVKPVYYDCHLCEERSRLREAEAKAKEALRLRMERRRAKNPYMLATIGKQLNEAEANRKKAIRESAGSAPAKTGVPVICATLPSNSNVDSQSGSQVKVLTHGYDLQSFTKAEQEAFNATMEGRAAEPSMWNALKEKVNEQFVDKWFSNWVARGNVIVPPAFG